MSKQKMCGTCADGKAAGEEVEGLGTLGTCRNSESVYYCYVFFKERKACQWWKCPACFDPYCGLDKEQAKEKRVTILHGLKNHGVTFSGWIDLIDENNELNREAAAELWGEEFVAKHETTLRADVARAVTREEDKVREEEESITRLMAGLERYFKKNAWPCVMCPKGDSPLPVTHTAVLLAGQRFVDIVRKYELYLGKSLVSDHVATALLLAVEQWDRATGQFEG